MKQIASNYTYNKTSGVITLTGVNIDRDQLLLIVNTTRNVTYYNFADSATTLQAFTQGANTSVTLASSVVSASSTHNNADALTIYYDDQVNSGTEANPLPVNFGKSWEEGLTLKPNIEPVFGQGNGGVGLLAVGGQTYTDPLLIPPIHVVSKEETNELPYIKANISITQTAGGASLVTNVFMRRIGQYKYQSISGWAGGEDEAYVEVELKASGGDQFYWQAKWIGGLSDFTPNFAFAAPQNKGNNTGDAFPPTTWAPSAGFTGTMTVSYEQPSTQPISGTVTALDLGAKADAVATTDTGTFSVIALIKRGLQNWTSLLAKIPTLVSGRIPVDGSGVTQPVSLASVPSHGVTGTFWQTTQPISGTVTANTGLTQPLTDTQLRATAVSVSTIPSQGTTVTNSTFTSTTPSTSLVSAVTGRRVLSVFNEGAGLLYISGGGTCTTASYQVRLGVGEYWECPNGQLALAHTAVFATAGTARVSQVS